MDFLKDVVASAPELPPASEDGPPTKRQRWDPGVPWSIRIYASKLSAAQEEPPNSYGCGTVDA
jgi:hypothetical protein